MWWRTLAKVETLTTVVMSDDGGGKNGGSSDCTDVAT